MGLYRNNTTEIYFKSLSAALYYFKIKSIDEITGIHLMLDEYKNQQA